MSSAYFAPIQYFCKLACAEQAFVEAYEHYQKQTYRTRCNILTSHGALTLSVPVEKVHGEKMLIRDVRIDYSAPWQRTHSRALLTAYSSSPFFMYYADEILPLFEQRETFLFDLNLKTARLLCEMLGIRTSIVPTERYEVQENNPLDFRQSISPKPAQQKADNNFYPQEYFQVFAHKLGFTPNLSILDLLFNEGPQALSLLKTSTQPLP